MKWKEHTWTEKFYIEPDAGPELASEYRDILRGMDCFYSVRLDRKQRRGYPLIAKTRKMSYDDVRETEALIEPPITGCTVLGPKSDFDMRFLFTGTGRNIWAGKPMKTLKRYNFKRIEVEDRDDQGEIVRILFDGLTEHDIYNMIQQLKGSIEEAELIRQRIRYGTIYKVMEMKAKPTKTKDSRVEETRDPPWYEVKSGYCFDCSKISFTAGGRRRKETLQGLDIYLVAAAISTIRHNHPDARSFKIEYKEFGRDESFNIENGAGIGGVASTAEEILEIHKGHRTKHIKKRLRKKKAERKAERKKKRRRKKGKK